MKNNLLYKIKTLKNFEIVIQKRLKQKLIMQLLNLFFGICSAGLLGFAFNRIETNRLHQIEVILVFGLAMLVGGDFFNINTAFKRESVYSRDKTELLPVSKIKEIMALYYYQLINARLFLYLIPVLVMLYFIIDNSFSKAILFFLFSGIVFLFSTLVMTVLYKLLNYLSCKFGENFQKFMVGGVLGLMLFFSVLKTNIVLSDILFSWLIDFITMLVN